MEHVTARRGRNPHEELFNRFDTMEEMLRFMAAEFMKFKGKPA